MIVPAAAALRLMDQRAVHKTPDKRHLMHKTVNEQKY